MECMNCGKEFEGKGKYCGSACKQAAYRNRNKGVTDVTVDVTADVTVIKELAKPKGDVSQAEIDALPQALKDDINELCDSNPEIYDDRDERLVRAVLYRRKFPGRPYHSNRFTG